MGCNQLFYFPTAGGEPPDGVQPLTFQSVDGVRLSALWWPAENAKGTAVQFHGNAGNVAEHIRALRWLHAAGYNVFAFDYRGYGASEGLPTRRGVHLDALAALDYAAARLPRAGRGDDLILVGQSLGGAILLAALAERQQLARVRRVVIESSFHSYREIATSVAWRNAVLFPFTGIAYGLTDDELAPSRRIGRIRQPLTFVHGLADPVVPPAFGVRLFELAPRQRALLLVPGGHHNGLMARAPAPYRKAYLTLLESADQAHCEALAARLGTLLCDYDAL